MSSLGKTLIVISLAITSDLLFASALETKTARIHSSDLQYQGAFRLPDELNWGARGMSYHPSGHSGKGSLFVTGFQGLLDGVAEPCHEGSRDCSAYFAEVDIPVPSTTPDWQALPVAALIQKPTIFDNGQVASVSQAYSMTSGIQYVPRQGAQTSDKLYGSLNAWYPEGEFGDDSFPTIWMSDLDGANSHGVFHVGPTDDLLFHGRKMGEYLFSVPQGYADRFLGGRTLVTGRSRGTPVGGGELTTSGGSQGPTLFAFHAWRSDNPSGNLDALPMLYYRSSFPGCAGPDIGIGGRKVNCDYPNFSMCDSWNGADFISNGGRSAILLLGQKGTTNCYYCDETAADPECPVKPLAGECKDWCGEGRGYHCGPYKRQVIFYDTAELGDAALGKLEPWTVLPYEIWEPKEFYVKLEDGNNCADVGGMAFDAQGKRLYVVERGLGGHQGDNAAVVHVWKVQTEN